jgi:2,3-bisphosphoglycerate-independent phosphoglycerate mutase
LLFCSINDLTMISLEQLSKICIRSQSRIILLVMDGLGGIPETKSGKTELQSSRIPNLHRLAGMSICGMADPVSAGVTPGSGPGHLALFGYNPLDWQIGRGVLEALGIDFDIAKHDIAARGNFCTIDSSGVILDRRAGRISTSRCFELCKLLSGIELGDIQVFVSPVREHRFLLVLRHSSLVEELSDTDPQRTGVLPLRCAATSEGAEVVNKFIEKATNLLQSQHPANMLLLRGFSKIPDIPSIPEIYKLSPAALASYPMYRGLAKLVGMQVLPAPDDIYHAMDILADNFENYDYFFIHYKGTDTAGEDGDFKKKIEAIEIVDKIIPDILSLRPDVLIVTADHSTPAGMKSHSWHSVPFMLYSKYCRADGVRQFTENDCIYGGLGIFPSQNIMALAMANALKLKKFGA